MIALAHAATLLGIDARLIEVEVELATGLPVLSVIGLGDTAIQEAKYRVQSAIRSAGLDLPHKRITINLAPADLRKDGAGLDVAIALALLAAAQHLPPGALDATLALGELSLAGTLRPVRGALAAAHLAHRLGYRRLVVPPPNAAEATAVAGLEIVAPQNFSALVAHLRGEAPLPALPPRPPRPAPREPPPDLADVRGQPLARRALEVAAAGGHNLLFIGPPGSGKTMLARRAPGILPALSTEESLEVTRVWSAAGLTVDAGLITERPFRAPHHTLSEAALIGGGSTIRPGEVSLAHEGVLFLDELPEVPRRVLESLRQPLEDHQVVVSRVRQTVTLPARFMLIAAANPCPCGWSGDPSGRCTCDPDQVLRYRARISGPILDRLDMIAEVPAVAAGELLADGPAEGSAEVRARVIRARARAADRGHGVNARLRGQALRAATAGHPRTRALLEEAASKLALSARALDRVTRVARTIADLAGEAVVTPSAVAEALRYRHAPSGRDGAQRTEATSMPG